jgi:hypothetical protein
MSSDQKRGRESFSDSTPVPFLNCRMLAARLLGVEPVKLTVGRRVFIRGADAIAFIEALAAIG